VKKSTAIQLLEEEIDILRSRVKQLERANKDLFRVNDRQRAELARYRRQENDLNRVNI
jgi:hypothetical protein